MNRIRKSLLYGLIGFVTTVLVLEIFARVVLGMGDPPLSIADPQIEYLFKPSQTYNRFGNIVHYNAYSMRSDNFPPQKANAEETRIMFLGDSVINGGVLTDQSEIATQLLQQKLRQALARPVVVGNISAGSWGPPNLLAYVRRYGLFDADIVVLVLSSHDYGDAPTFESIVGVNPNFPDKTPWLALQEAIVRYLPKYLPGPLSMRAPSTKPKLPSKAEIEQSVGALETLCEIASAQGARIVLVQHWEIDELSDGPGPGRAFIQKACADYDVIVLDDKDVLMDARKKGKYPYRDNIHLTSYGQRVLAELLQPLLARLAREIATTDRL